MTHSDDGVWVDFDDISRETEAALEIAIDGKRHWLPKSQVLMLFEKTKKVKIPEWLANKRGLI